MNTISKEKKAKTKEQREADVIESIKAKAQMTYFDAEKKEVKSLKEILDKTTEVQEVFIPVLGCMVKLGHISMNEFSALRDIKDPNEVAIQMLFKLLQSADETVTIEYIRELPFHVVTAITEAVMVTAMGFLKDTT